MSNHIFWVPPTAQSELLKPGAQVNTKNILTWISGRSSGHWDLLLETYNCNQSLCFPHIAFSFAAYYCHVASKDCNSGNDLGYIVDDVTCDRTLCKEWCDARADCAAFVYNVNNHECWFKAIGCLDNTYGSSAGILYVKPWGLDDTNHMDCSIFIHYLAQCEVVAARNVDGYFSGHKLDLFVPKRWNKTAFLSDQTTILNCVILFVCNISQTCMCWNVIFPAASRTVDCSNECTG